MLQKYTFNMLCEESGAVRGLGGSEVHGLLFKLIKENDATRATLLHDTVDKPFALGPLTGICGRKKQFTYCREGEIYSISVSCLNQEMTELVERIARIWPGLCVRLGSGTFTGNKVTKKYPTGLYYGDLFQTYRAPGEITFEFITPTSFRQQGTKLFFHCPSGFLVVCCIAGIALAPLSFMRIQIFHMFWLKNIIYVLRWYTLKNI